MNKMLIVIIAAVILSACQTEANFKKEMLSWIGKDINNMVADKGYPTRELTAPNGNRVYVYSETGTYVTPVETTYNTIGNVYGNNSTTYATSMGGIPVTFKCEVYVEFDKSNIIQKINWKGNNCVM